MSNFQAENKETPQQLEPESKNGVACKIKNMYLVRFNTYKGWYNAKEY